MNRNLDRRIKALEEIHLAFCKDRLKIAKRAVGCIRWQAEPFLKALAAKSHGRELTADDSKVMQAYEEALTGECHCAGYASSEGFENIKDELKIEWAMYFALLHLVSPEVIELGSQAELGQQEGRALTLEEEAALQSFHDEVKALSRRTGILAPDEACVQKEVPQ